MRIACNPRLGALLLAMVAGACWADFPERRPGDGAPPSPDGGGVTEAGRRDRLPLADAVGTVCTPNAFVRCPGPSQLEKCNALGTETVIISCGAAGCDEALQRCKACDPAQPPTCRDGDAITCSADGLEQVKQCPDGCEDGACCTDGDGDGHSPCDGDCNDGDPKVFPGQIEFQTEPSAGSFDYNCDGQVEQENEALATECVFSNGTCTGSGWEEAVPDCGNEGSFKECNPRGGSCTPKTGKRRQACR